MAKILRRALVLSALVLLAAFPSGPACAQTFDLTGAWRDDNGIVSAVRQVGEKVCWYADARPRVHNVFCGIIAGSSLTGNWLDLPGGELQGSGQLALRVESNDRILKVGSSAPYGASVWTRVAGAAAASRSGSVVGTWSWAFAPSGDPQPSGQTVTINPDGTMTSSGGASGTWTQSGNQLTLTWTQGSAAGSIDDLTLSVDGRTLNGQNRHGWRVRGTRQ